MNALSSNWSFNPGMQVPQPAPCGNSLNFSVFQNAQARASVESVAIQDAFLPSLAQDGRLNREEFINLSAQQNEMARLAGLYASDGVVTDQERARLSQNQAKFQEDLAHFRNGDCHPSNNLSRKGIAGTQDRQSAYLYDSVRSGRISTETALNLRMQMSSAAYQQGQGAGAGLSADAQAAQMNGRLGQTWNQLGTGQVPRSGWSADFGGLPSM